MTQFTSRTAIVIGGSIAGLMTARVLSDHFEHVTLIERDEPGTAPEARKGVPQGQHLHALLARGGALLDRYFEGFTAELVAQGALAGDPGTKMRWFVDGDYRIPCTFGRDGILLSRPLVETTLRNRVRRIANVSMLTRADVQGVLTTPDKARVVGVRVECRHADGSHEARELRADLVVDCAGRGSAAHKWLEALGYPAPPESIVKVDLAYATRVYRRRPDQGEMALFMTPTAPHELRGAGAFPIEGDRWIVTQAGYLGDHPPTDERGFNEFARSLPMPDIYALIKDSEPLSDIVAFKYPASRRRHFEKLNRHPEGYLALGDAICSFNPVYGQGMSSAVMQVDALNALIARAPASIDGLWRRFYKAAAKVVDMPWQLAVGADFAYPQVQGARPRGTDLINRYMAAVQRATHSDPVVHARFLACVHLLKPAASLFAPDIVVRVWRASWSGRHTPVLTGAHVLAPVDQAQIQASAKLPMP